MEDDMQIEEDPALIKEWESFIERNPEFDVPEDLLYIDGWNPTTGQVEERLTKVDVYALPLVLDRKLKDDDIIMELKGSFLGHDEYYETLLKIITPLSTYARLITQFTLEESKRMIMNLTNVSGNANLVKLLNEPHFAHRFYKLLDFINSSQFDPDWDLATVRMKFIESFGPPVKYYRTLMLDENSQPLRFEKGMECTSYRKKKVDYRLHTSLSDIDPSGHIKGFSKNSTWISATRSAELSEGIVNFLIDNYHPEFKGSLVTYEINSSPFYALDVKNKHLYLKSKGWMVNGEEIIFEDDELHPEVLFSFRIESQKIRVFRESSVGESAQFEILKK
jgi:hypothetical protein